MSKPVVLFVPGAWHGPWAFESLRSNLEARGYTCVSIDNPSVGLRDPPVFTHLEDSNHVRANLRYVIDVLGKDVVLVAHSYGGTVCIDAVRGWAKGEPKGSKELQDTGSELPIPNLSLASAEAAKDTVSGTGTRPNGVVGVIFIASPLPGFGKGMAAVYKTMPLTEVEPQEPLHPAYLRIKNPYYWFYHDIVPESAAAAYVNKIQPQAAGPMASPITGSPCWKHVPCAYVATRNDRAVPYDDQLSNIDAARKESKYSWEVTTIDSCHSPMLVRPQETGDAVARYIESAVSIMA